MPDTRSPKPSRYDFKKGEKKWQTAWQKEGVYEPKLKGADKRKPFYNLMMFPYPSAEGLHIGSVRTFSGVDIYGRLKRMQGYDVFEPIGLDGFGIHSENYAMKIDTHPAKQAVVSAKRFYGQLQETGNGFAWDERLETYDPDYYRWTQWIFTKLWKAGLAYRKKQAVNWCPKDQTVLADEQVEAGKCERCGAVVEKRELEQWFFRITKYAERLLKNLDKLDWTQKIKSAQHNWIGKSEGALIRFEVAEHAIEVFTTRPDTIFGATFLVVSPEVAKQWLEIGWPASEEVKEYIKKSLLRPEMDRLEEKIEKTGVAAGFDAINPATKEKIPVWIADYVLGSYGTGAIMAVPAHDERDAAFAKKHDLPMRTVVENGLLVNSDSFDGRSSGEVKKDITKFAGGEEKIQYRLRDWLVSRQRYWGPPIPMIFCEACAAKGKGEQKEMPGWYAVPEKDLPVKLPVVKDFRPEGTGKAPLASVRSFYEVKCPACRAKARRETDVSDTFLDSAWYYLRYPNVNEKRRPWDPTIIKKWFPVNMYIGGPEHSVLHLLYVRFMALALYDLGLLKIPKKGVAPAGEPFPTFRAHGLITKDGAKMSKSKGNVVNPDEYIKKFGVDVMRMYLAFLAPLEQGGDFREEGISGITRFLDRVWAINQRSVDPRRASKSAKPYRVPDDLKRAIHKTIKKVGEDIEGLNYNTAISALMILLNAAEEQEKAIALPLYFFEIFALLLAPFAPYLAEELWRGVLGHKRSIHLEAWPKYAKEFLVDSSVKLIVQVNSKVRATIEVTAGMAEAEARELALAHPNVQAALQGQAPQRVIYVPGRIINIVV